MLNRLIHWARLKSPWIIHFNSGACNACDIEILAALTPKYDVERFGIQLKGAPRHADVLICSGPVTLQQRERMITIYEQMSEPKFVIAVGTCACSAGIFDGCYCVEGGVDTAIPVDAYVPGCPVKPEAIIDGVVKLLESLEIKEGYRVNNAKSIVKSLVERFPALEGKANIQSARRIFLSVPLESLMDCLHFCNDDLGFTHLTTITGLDNGEEFEFLYHIACEGGAVLTLKVKTARDGGVLASVMPIYNGAIFYELELQGLLGVTVEGLPKDRQYPLPDNWPKGQYPMRKDWKPPAAPEHPAL